jgi:hypothetical protein
VQLPKAVAVRFASANQVDADANSEEDQERERPYSTPESGEGGYQSESHRKLCEGQ